MKFEVKVPSISLPDINFSPREQFDKIWSSVDGYVTPRLMSTLDKGLGSEIVLNTLFQGAYEALPLPVRLLMPQDKFMSYCEGKREYFHGKVIGITNAEPLNRE